jgi:hypothetical protein
MRLVRILKWAGILLGGAVLLLAVLLGYWYLRPNQSFTAPSLDIQTWDAIMDGAHNSNTDLIDWQGAFYLVHASAPFHFASEKTRLFIWKSTDAVHWEKTAEFNAAGQDIRDPKLAVIHNRLYLYALKNVEFTAEPYSTVFSFSDDGLHWSAFKDIQPEGWLFWRPKSKDGITWYVPAYWHEHGKSSLLTSTDGANWSTAAPIYEGDRNDETDIEFLPDGRMICTARLEVSDNYFGDNRGSTLVGVASAPYDRWTHVKSQVTRLDGPNLFSYRGQVYAVGRYQPVPRPFPFELGSILSRKRTSLFLVKEDGLTYLTDLPSAGDTSYAGVVIRGDDLYISYYTSDIHRDVPWILGMVGPSDIRMAKVNLPSLEELAQTQLR